MFSTPKPYSAVTVQIDRLTSEQYEENDIGGIVDLIEVIRIQSSGPTEAARAIRKKLKYGNVHRQLRALTILDGLIQNAGTRFQRAFADEPLLERLRVMARDDMVDSEVKAKCNLLFRQWAVGYKGTPGLTGISTLSKELPRTKRRQPSQSKVIRETAQEAQHDEPPPPQSHKRSTSSTQPSNSRAGSAATITPAATLPSTSLFKKSNKSKNKPFNLEKEKPQLLETLASASVASTNLLNALQLINREVQRVSDNPEVLQRFDTCKQLRRRILRYIQLVESDQWIGGLISANDELVRALMAYEIMDKSIDDDSDSETEAAIARSAAEAQASSPPRDALARLDLGREEAPARPPRPTSLGMPPPPPQAFGKQRVEESESEEDEAEADEDDPFGDQNAVKTPFVEKDGMTWRDV